jgi:3-hydroxybutyrate dehydrogenase
MLRGKWALVTGATAGLGLAVAESLAGAGANIVLHDLVEPQETRDRLRSRFDVEVVSVAADLSQRSSIETMMADLLGRLAPIDILVNNAVIRHFAPVEDFTPEHWEEALAVNLSAPFHLIRLALPAMKKRGWGRIINTASAHSLVASPFKAAYVSAKHGIAGLTKTVALELATFKITCNCISPGYVWTPLVEHQIPETMKARNLTKEQVIHDVLLAAQPTKEFVTSEQVAALALFLCGDDAAQITGTNLSIDGGWTAE